jgi:hypothetical protein
LRIGAGLFTIGYQHRDHVGVGQRNAVCDQLRRVRLQFLNARLDPAIAGQS